MVCGVQANGRLLRSPLGRSPVPLVTKYQQTCRRDPSFDTSPIN